MDVGVLPRSVGPEEEEFYADSHRRWIENLYLSPVSAVVQLRPQLHHIDASEEVARARASRRKDADDENSARPETEARVVDVKVKSADGADAALAENVELLKTMQDEHWDLYEWVDANVSNFTSLVFALTNDSVMDRPRKHGPRTKTT